MENLLAKVAAKGFTPSGIIDVGAHDGAFARAARTVYPGARILMVDALAEKDQQLARVCEDIGNSAYVISLLGDREAAASSFHVVDTQSRPDLVTTGSSKFRESSAFPMKERSIPQRTLASVMAGQIGRFQLLKLDVQGAEIDVVKGAGERLSEIEMILAEVSLLPYNEGAPLVDEVLTAFRSMGFCLYDIAAEHRYRDGSLLQIDGVFVRPDASFRPKPPYWS